METIIGAAPRPAAAKGNGSLIKDSSTADFMADVVEASMQQPVIVDFWAPWCGPCKQLGPALEKAVTAAAGTVRMVKINVDQNQELAAQMRIQSIPAVYAFSQGRPVDGFVGALPDSQVKAFVDRVVKAGGAAAPGPSPVEAAYDEAKEALSANDLGTASALFGEILAHEPDHLGAIAGLARCHIAAGDREKARALLAPLNAEQARNAEVIAAQSALELADQAAKTAGVMPQLVERLAADPNDHQARFDLALAHYAAGAREEAVNELIELVRRNREWNEQAARKQLVKLFEAFGFTDPLAVEGRKRLSSILFS